MKSTFWHQLALMAAITGSITEVMAIPAPRELINITQPDGSKLNAYMKGDEFFHYALSTDGYVLLPDERGFYTYALPDDSGSLKPSKVIATNIALRSTDDASFLKRISPGMSFSEKQKAANLNRKIEKGRLRKADRNNIGLRNANGIITDGLISTFPTTGTVKSVVILVNFSDVSFTTADAGSVFRNMLNKEGYNDGYHVGSARDYYIFNSSGAFTPEFVVAGPVTLDKTMDYYGKNDDNGEDVHPAEMVRDACILADKTIDFSQFDADSDGIVDNIYIYYAGYGEADGGSTTTIWPHSWYLEGENIELTLDGKKISTYACSNEINKAGNRVGIGTFSHEYGHVLGLPDFYDVDYEYYNGEAFDLCEWSIMSYGSYNADGCVPPALSILERKLLGWAKPIELDDISTTISLPPIDSSNIGYIINTSDPKEYFLIENRQQRIGSWDFYIPAHGMLIYHIDMRSNADITISYNGIPQTWTFSNLWEMNMVNAVSTHQCADIEEADGVGVIYSSIHANAYKTSLLGDPFPGSKNITSFTDDTAPSMRTWSGATLNKPVTGIIENGGIITFDFKGGSDFEFRKPVVSQAYDIGSFKFTASWKPLPSATGYYIDVFKLDLSSTGDTLRTFLAGYQNLFVADTLLTINEVDDQTIYQYRVRATNNYVICKNSDFAEVETTNAPEIIAYVKDRTIYLKGIDHNSKVRLYKMDRLVSETSETNEFNVGSPGIYIADVIINGKRKVIKIIVK